MSFVEKKLQKKKLLKDTKPHEDKKELEKFVNVLAVVEHHYLFIMTQDFVQTVMLAKNKLQKC